MLNNSILDVSVADTTGLIEPKTMGNAVIYARTATTVQAECGYSIESQIAECKKFAVDSGYTVAKVFVDESKSVINLERPAYSEMTNYCETHDVDAVIVWKLNRLTRNTMDYHGEIRPFLEKHGIKLLSATELNEDTIEAELKCYIGIDFAEYERKLIGKRTVLGLKSQAERGIYPHKPPVGYKNIKINNEPQIIIDPDNAQYVKMAYELCATGISAKEISEKLYTEGFRTRNGKKIPKSRIEFVLKNPFYVGKFKFVGKMYDGVHTPIISKELFDMVQDVLKKSNK